MVVPTTSSSGSICTSKKLLEPRHDDVHGAVACSCKTEIFPRFSLRCGKALSFTIPTFGGIIRGTLYFGENHGKKERLPRKGLFRDGETHQHHLRHHSRHLLAVRFCDPLPGRKDFAIAKVLAAPLMYTSPAFGKEAF